MGILESGDRLVVSELSKLGRLLGQIVAMLDTLGWERVAFMPLRSRAASGVASSTQTKVITTLYTLFGEFDVRFDCGANPRRLQARDRPSVKKLGRRKGSVGVSRLDDKKD